MELSRSNIPLIVILGPTASGKSSLAIRLAQEFNGEIVSADSRQTYRRLDIGSGKVTQQERAIIRHHLLDVVDPDTRFTVAEYKKMADEAIGDIWSRGTIPFLVGGSSLYLDVVVENYQLPIGDQDVNYRLMLEQKNTKELIDELQLVDPVLCETIDRNNKRRLIRALEVFHLSGIPLSKQKRKGDDVYHSLVIGIEVDREELYMKIDRRVDERMQDGMLEEIMKLLSDGVSVCWLKSLGLEYRILTQFLCGSDHSNKALSECIQLLKYAIHDFARRQLVWYRKNENIHWCSTIDLAREQIVQLLMK